MLRVRRVVVRLPMQGPLFSLHIPVCGVLADAMFSFGGGVVGVVNTLSFK